MRFIFACLNGNLFAECDPFFVGHVIVRSGLKRIAAKLLFGIAQVLRIVGDVKVLSGIDHALL